MIEEINNKQEEINKLRSELDKKDLLLAKAEVDLRDLEYKVEKTIDYIDYLRDNPTYKSYGTTLKDIETYLKGGEIDE